MPFTLQVPSEYGYVLTVASTSLLVNVYHMWLTARARNASGIKYPNSYASNEQAEKDPKAFKFNCAQRAHGNFVENFSPFLGSLLISGLRFPVASAVLGAAWVAGRVWYAVGYTAHGPAARRGGFYLSSLGDLSLKLMAVWTSLQMVSESA